MASFPPEILTIQCRTQNRPSSPLKDSTLSVLYQQCSGRWSLGYNRVKTRGCELLSKQHPHHYWLSCRPATGHSSGQLWLLLGSRPVNSRPAKWPGCLNRLCSFTEKGGLASDVRDGLAVELAQTKLTWGAGGRKSLHEYITTLISRSVHLAWSQCICHFAKICWGKEFLESILKQQNDLP
jgi:hypothetical protein